MLELIMKWCWCQCWYQYWCWCWCWCWYWCWCWCWCWYWCWCWCWCWYENLTLKIIEVILSVKNWAKFVTLNILFNAMHPPPSIQCIFPIVCHIWRSVWQCQKNRQSATPQKVSADDIITPENQQIQDVSTLFINYQFNRSKKPAKHLHLHLQSLIVLIYEQTNG